MCAVTVSDGSGVTSKVFAESAEEKAHPWGLWPGTGVPQQILVLGGGGCSGIQKGRMAPDLSSPKGRTGWRVPHGGPSESDP